MLNRYQNQVKSFIFNCFLTTINEKHQFFSNLKEIL